MAVIARYKAVQALCLLRTIRRYKGNEYNTEAFIDDPTIQMTAYIYGIRCHELTKEIVRGWDMEDQVIGIGA